MAAPAWPGVATRHHRSRPAGSSGVDSDDGRLPLRQLNDALQRRRRIKADRPATVMRAVSAD